MIRIEQETIPNDWDVRILGDIADVSSGGSAPQGDKYFNGENPFVRVQHIDQDSDSIIRYDLITDEAVKKYKLKKYKSGTIVFPKSGASIYLKKRAMLPVDAYIVSHLCAVNSAQEDVYQEFLFYGLKQILLSKEKADGYPTLNLSEVKRVVISLPSFLEQKKVVRVLSGIKEAITLQEQIIAKTKELKRSLMQRLFTYGLRGEELKETEIGLMPESWEVVRLGDGNVLEMVQYGISVRGESSGKYPILRMNSIIGGYVVAEKLQYVDITLELFKKFSLEQGDILFNRTNSIDLVGKTGIFNLTGEYTFASYLIRLRTNKRKLNPEFLNLYLNIESSQERLKTLATRGVSQSNISGSRLKTLCIPLPPDLDEQKEIAHILLSVDKKLFYSETRKQTLQSLFKTMLQLLMTGQVRVRDIDFGEGYE